MLCDKTETELHLHLILEQFNKEFSTACWQKPTPKRKSTHELCTTPDKAHVQEILIPLHDLTPCLTQSTKSTQEGLNSTYMSPAQHWITFRYLTFKNIYYLHKIQPRLSQATKRSPVLLKSDHLKVAHVQDNLLPPYDVTMINSVNWDKTQERLNSIQMSSVQHQITVS